jgi:prolyl oligopeptidase
MGGIAAWVGVSSAAEKARKTRYPAAMMQDVVDDYHGGKVADPYRWLEDPESPETVAWVTEENALTRAYLDSYEKRDAIEERFTALWNYPRYSVPHKHGTRYFFSKNDGLQNQAVLYVQESLDGEPRVLIDPNALSEDGTVALRGRHYSRDGRYIAYGLSSSGSDWQQIRVRDVDTGKDFDDLLEWCKFSDVAWKRDNSGFWYNRFPAEGEVAPEDRNNYNRVYWHRLDTPQSADLLVYKDDANKELGFEPTATDDGAYLLLTVYHGTDPRNGVYYRTAAGDGEFTRLVENDVAMFSFIDNVGSVFYFHTDLDAPRGRVIAIDVARPEREHWREIIAEREEVIDFVDMVGGRIVVAYMRDAHNTLAIFGEQGAFERQIELPTIGSVGGLSGEREDSEMFFGFTSFLFPTTAYRYDFAANEVSVFRASEIDFDASGYETRQVFYSSLDGTRVPMFLMHKKGIALDGNNPTILYGYGGFNISMTPYFSVSRLIWLENGGVYAVANLRGGNEYGEDWHQQGILDRKQNVFDDFIAAAEYLIAEKYTRSERLAISGGSNGGLLVAACMTQRPELFGAVLCQVPVIDMLRYHKFTVGRYWVSDYGNAEASKEHFDFLYAYSPLHNIKEDFAYPPTLITTADTDDRVVPAHGKKFAAALQAADAGENPILLRVETKAGHGGGKPTAKIIEEVADIYAFLFKTFALSAPEL